MSATLDLTRELIGRRSVSPQDAGCQELLIARLEPLGFEVHRLRIGDVDNFWAIRRSAAGPVVCFAGHTDVVPPGPLERWSSDPFVPTVRDGLIYGRGVADMKSGVAAMVTATEAFIASRPRHAGAIAFLITSDEEGPSVDGTRRVVEWLRERGQAIDYCLIGEPSSLERFGDNMRVGRRGSLTGRLTVHGIQGHVAYPERADNPIHRLAPALAELTARAWDRGSGHFQPTSLQFSSIGAGTGATNVIPGELVIDFNFRFSTESTPASLKERVLAVLDRHGLDYELPWVLGGEPFLTPVGSLSEAVVAAIRAETGLATELSTTGGTSDGRFIAKICPQVIELGPVNASIHKIDEWVTVADIEPLKNIYRGILERMLA
jgi:succinyl-diaminopimelate desuccinylase